MKAPSIKLPHCVIVKAPGLLPMLYTPRELAEATGAVERTLRDWLNAGAPHTRDSRGHTWINGREFSGWVEGIRKNRRRIKLKDNEAYCLRCGQAVELVDADTRHVRGKLTLTRGICPRCQCTIHRGGRIASIPTRVNQERS